MIYSTPYDPVTLLCTGPSIDTGLDSLEDVPLLFGAPAWSHPHMLTYPDHGVAYTNFLLSVDTAVTVAANCAEHSTE